MDDTKHRGAIFTVLEGWHHPSWSYFHSVRGMAHIKNQSYLLQVVVEILTKLLHDESEYLFHYMKNVFITRYLDKMSFPFLDNLFLRNRNTKRASIMTNDFNMTL